MGFQKAIIREFGSRAVYLTFKCIGNPAELVRACKLIPELTSHIKRLDKDSAIVSAVGFGAEFWSKIASSQPKHLNEFIEINGKPGVAPATGGDVFLHIKSNRHDLNFELAQNVIKSINGFVEIIDETHGFTYLDARDLTGFIDGTENPKEVEERKEVALIADEDVDFTNGSYVLTQKFVHNLKKWQSIDDSAQEDIIGRTKSDSVSLQGDRKLATSHISRSETHEGNEELKIVRHSLPFGEATGDKGLFFIAYAKDQSIFDKMLARIYGTSGDDCHDHLMQYTAATTGAYFFVPSEELLQQL